MTMTIGLELVLHHANLVKDMALIVREIVIIMGLAL